MLLRVKREIKIKQPANEDLLRLLRESYLVGCRGPAPELPARSSETENTVEPKEACSAQTSFLDAFLEALKLLRMALHFQGSTC
jgi:hypothetical protein